MSSFSFTLASLVVGPIEFERPAWLLIIPAAWVVIVLLARRSLAGLDQGWRIAAVVIRLLVVGMLLAAIAEPSWRKESKDRTVLAVLDVSESVPRELQAKVEAFIERGATADEFKDKKLGFVTTARDALPGQLASKLNRAVAYEHQGKLDATDIAAGLRLAIAIMPRDAGNRLLLATDGNQTAGDVIQAANAAAALGIPIDVIPLKYEYTGEVMLDKLIAPATAREGETLTVRVVLQASAPTTGRLNLLLNGEQIDLDQESSALGVAVSLREGQNVLQVPVPARRSGPQQFEAVFEPDRGAGGAFEGDTLAQNNRSSSVTFVEGEGRVLVLGNPQSPSETGPLMEALQVARIRAELREPSAAPQTLTDMSAFDAIVLVNQSADGYTQAQQEALRQYVNDTGGGLMMIGGPNSFGAGGWIGSPLEEALPLRLDPPQKRQMPRGALVLCIHSVEMPNGVFYGKRVCEAAVNRLSRLDLVGINEFTGWGGGGGNTGHRWIYDLKPVGDGSEVKRAIESLTFGDMQDFTPSFQLSYDALAAAQAGQKHMIVISDGDPSPPPDSLLRKFIAAKITVSTVGVFPHSGLDTSRMQEISRLTGGRHYEVNTEAMLAKLPEIFVKEAMTVRRSLIFEAPGAGLPVGLFGGLSETLRGIASTPNVNGYVVTAEREGLALVTAKLNATKDNPQGDPLLAQWQYGLGRVIAYTSDATTKWNPQWTAWAGYRQFWEQHTRWVLRPQGSNNVRVVTENRGDGTLINVEAFDTAGERLSFANFRGRLARPDGSGVDVTLQQVAPGRYQTTVPSELSGNYVLSLRYAAADENVEGGVLEGSVQAAISRPFADEYRVLRDNTALLMQVAQITGGRVLSLDAAGTQAPELWSDEGVELPVARTPIWLAVTLAALGLFLLDVAVRRVRADFAALKKRVLGAFAKRQAANAQLGGLRAAREQARERIKLRSEQTGQRLSEREIAEQAQRDVAQAQQVASKKFEASAEDLQAARERATAMGGTGAMPSRQPPKPAAGPGGMPGAKGGAEAGGMDRLMAAKRKARDDLDEGEKQ